MAQSPYKLLTVFSSNFSGSATGVADLGGVYRNLQSVTYTSSDAVVVGSVNISIQKCEDPNNTNSNAITYQGYPYYEDTIGTHDISTDGAIYDKTKQYFFRYVRATLTGSSSHFTAGSVNVTLYFDGPQTP